MCVDVGELGVRRKRSRPYSRFRQKRTLREDVKRLILNRSVLFEGTPEF